MKVDPSQPITEEEITSFMVNLMAGPAPDCTVLGKYHEDGCTIHVFARLRTCKGYANICADAAIHIYKAKEEDRLCGGCHEPVSECWRVIPI